MKTQTTGSKSLSEIAKECGITGGKFKLTIEGEASPVAASVKAGTARLSAEDFFLALASCGAVRKPILRRAIGFAIARAKGEKAECAKGAKLAKRIGAIYKSKVPPIESPATIRIKATAEAIA